jgi:hypothetical protein
MASSTKNVKLGVCNVFFDGVDLGLTKGGVEVTVTTETYKVDVDQFGTTVINEQIMGRNVMVMAPLAETTLRNLVATMPGSMFITNGVNAKATLTVGANPDAEADAFAIGGQAFSTVAAGTKPTDAYSIVIGTSLTHTLNNVVDVINRANLQPAIGGIRATLTSPTTISVEATDPGLAGNAVTIDATLEFSTTDTTLTGGVEETKARVEVMTGIGIDLLSRARVLRLHPRANAATDFKDDFVIYQAATPGALTFAYQVDSERIYNIEFSGYPDSQERLFSIGDLLA